MWLKNQPNLPARQQDTLAGLRRPPMQLATTQAYRWKHGFQAFYDHPAGDAERCGPGAPPNAAGWRRSKASSHWRSGTPGVFRTVFRGLRCRYCRATSTPCRTPSSQYLLWNLSGIETGASFRSRMSPAGAHFSTSLTTNSVEPSPHVAVLSLSPNERIRRASNPSSLVRHHSRQWITTTPPSCPGHTFSQRLGP